MDSIIPNESTTQEIDQIGLDSADTQSGADETAKTTTIEGVDSANADTETEVDPLKEAKSAYANAAREAFETSVQVGLSQVRQNPDLILSIGESAPKVADKIIRTLSSTGEWGAGISNFKDLKIALEKSKEQKALDEEINSSADPELKKEVIAIKAELQEQKNKELRASIDQELWDFCSKHPSLLPENDIGGAKWSLVQAEIDSIDLGRVSMSDALEKAWLLSGLQSEDDKKFLSNTERQMGTLPSSSGTFVPRDEISEEARRMSTAFPVDPSIADAYIKKNYKHVTISS